MENTPECEFCKALPSSSPRVFPLVLLSVHPVLFVSHCDPFILLTLVPLHVSDE